MEEGRKVRPAPRGVQLKWDSTKMGIVWFIWWVVRDLVIVERWMGKGRTASKAAYIMPWTRRPQDDMRMRGCWRRSRRVGLRECLGMMVASLSVVSG